MRHKLAVLCIVALTGVSCSAEDDAPSLDGATSAQLEAAAIWRACSETVCAGSPILVSDSTRDEVRSELAQSTDEIQYVSVADIEALASEFEPFPDRATLFRAARARTMDKPGVVGVDVSISKAPLDLLIRTYLFRWDGDAWIESSPDSVGVTVTSTVS